MLGVVLEGNIIIADDDKSIRTVLGQALTRAGCRVKLTGTISTLWKWVEDGEGDVIIVDVMMPDGDTLDILPVLKRKRGDTPIIVMSAVNTVNTAVRAIESGAFDYLSKPFDLSKLVSTVNLALKSRYKVKSGASSPTDNSEKISDNIKIVGSSEVMQLLYKSIAKISSSKSNILINGLSGTGKSLLAEYIHEISDKRAKKFIELRLGSVGEVDQGELLNRTLFEIKNNFINIGSIFFDEISNLSAVSQKQILEILDFIEKIGLEKKWRDEKPLVISSTSINLEGEMATYLFREDLYYRLNGISLNLPKLNNRSEDIEQLIRYFLVKEGFEKKKFSQSAIRLLEKQDWRGNVRELRNFVLRLVTLSPNIEISENKVSENLELKPDFIDDNTYQETAKKGMQLSSSIEFHLKKYFDNHNGGLPPPGLYDRLLRELELPLIKIALSSTNGNQIKASTLLGLNRNTLRKKIKSLDINFDKKNKF